MMLIREDQRGRLMPACLLGLAVLAGCGDTWLGGNLPKSERLQLNEILLLNETLAPY